MKKFLSIFKNTKRSEFISLITISFLIQIIFFISNLGVNSLYRWMHPQLGSFFLHLNYISPFIIPFIFPIWLISVDKKFSFVKHLIQYPFMILTFGCFSVLILNYQVTGLQPIMVLFIFALGAFSMNLIILKIQKRKLNLKQKSTIFFTCFIVPLMSEILCILVYFFLRLLLQKNTLPGHILAMLPKRDHISLFLNKSMSFSLYFSILFMIITLYEGLFILYLRNRVPTIPEKMNTISVDSKQEAI